MNNARRALVALMLVVVGVLGTGVPASAAKTDCAANRWCLWDPLNWTGYPMISYPPLAVGECRNVPDAVNDRMTSHYNRTSTYIKMYRHANCVEQFSSAVGPGGSWYNMGATCCNNNDVLTSFYRYK